MNFSMAFHRLHDVIKSDLNMAQDKFCELTGFSKSHLSEIISGSRGKRLNVEHIGQFCAKIPGLKPWQFFYDPKNQQDMIELTNDPRISTIVFDHVGIKDIMNLYMSLDEAGKKNVQLAARHEKKLKDQRESEEAEDENAK